MGGTYTPELPIDFELPAHTGRLYRLGDHLSGPVVVMFNRGDW